MMTIGTFAQRTGLSVSAVRFYGDRGLLAPAQVDRHSGYRFYAEAQVTDGRLVAELRRMDMPLAAIGRALTLDEHGRTKLVTDHLRHLESILHRARSIARTLEPRPRSPECTMTVTDSTTDPAAGPTAVAAHALARAIEQVLPAVGTDPEQPHFMGVLVEAKAGSLRFVATDRHRLTVRDLVPTRPGEGFAVVIAGAALARWLPSLDAMVDLTLQPHLKELIASGPGVELRAAIVPPPFHDYEALLTSSAAEATVTVDRLQLLDALDAFDGDDPVQLIATSGRLSVSRHDRTNELEATVAGPDNETAINPRYGADAVSSAVGAEVVVELNGPLHPLVFRSADDGTYTSLLMPVKVSEV